MSFQYRNLVFDFYDQYEGQEDDSVFGQSQCPFDGLLTEVFSSLQTQFQLETM